MRSKWILISIPFIIVILFLSMAYFSRQKYFDDVNPSGYQGLEHRKYPYLVSDYSDVDIVIDINSIDPQNRSVSVSFFIRGWFTKNYTNFIIWEGYCIYKNLNITNTGGGPLHYFYQIEEGDRGPYLHYIWGYPERFPYDYYKIRYCLRFWNIDPDLTFPSGYHPSISVKAPTGWTARSFMKVTGNEPSLDREVYIVLSRAVRVFPSLEKCLSSSATFLVIGCLWCLFIALLIRVPPGAEKVLAIVTLNIGPLSLFGDRIGLSIDRYISYVPKTGGISYVELLFLSMIVNNIIFIACSILGMFLPKQIHDISLWDFVGLTTTSLIFCTTYFINPSFLPEIIYIINPLRFYEYIDHRLLLWLTLYVPLMWFTFLRKENVLWSYFMFTCTGLSVLVFIIFDYLTQDLEPFLLLVSSFLLFIGMLGLFHRFIKYSKMHR